MKKLMAVLGAALAAGLSFADDFTWVGPSGGDYAEPTNWEVNGETATAIPGKNDHVIFDPGEGQTLVVTNDFTSKNVGNIYIRDISIRSGTVKLLSPRAGGHSGAYYPFIKVTDDVTNTLYVAEGAEFYTYFRYSPTTAKKGLVNKTGKGLARFCCNAWYGNGDSYRIHDFVVSEGEFRMENIYAQRVWHWTVRNGGKATYQSYSNLNGCERATVEKGGLMTFSELSGQYGLSGFEGDGEINFASARGKPFVNLNLNGGPYRWAGTFTSPNVASCCFCNFKENTSFPATDEMRHFPIVGSNQYADFMGFCAGMTPEFEPGVGDFYLAPLLASAGTEFVTADTNGAPIALHANIFTGTDFLSYLAGKQNQVTITGPGEWWPRSGTTVVTGNQVRVTGTVGVPSGATLQFGNGTDAAADFTEFPFAITNLGTLAFDNVEALTVTTQVRGAGAFVAKRPVTLSDARLAGVTADGTDGGALTLTGSSRITVDTISLANGGKLTLDGPGVIASGAWTVSANAGNVYHGSLKGPGFARVGTTTGDSLLTIRNGAEFDFGYDDNIEVPDMVLEDGGSFVVAEAKRLRGTDASRRTITLEGGSIDFTGRFTSYEGDFAYSGDRLRIGVGEKGGSLGSRNSSAVRYASAPSLCLNVPVEDVAPAEADGGVFRIDCGMPVRPTKAWSLKGPFAIADTRFQVDKAFLDLFADGRLFGTGDLMMESGAWLDFGGGSTEMSAHVAWADGRKLRVTGATRIDLGVATSWAKRTAPLTLTVGPSGAAESSLVVEPGAALTLWSPDGNAIKAMNANFRILVNGGVDCHADGRTKAPLFLLANAFTDFLEYDAAFGLTNFNGYADGLAGGAGSTALVKADDRLALEAGETAVGAMKIVLSESNTKSVTIPEGSTLKVGNGTDPGVILFQLEGTERTYVPFDGAGAVDFGTSKGVIANPYKGNLLYTRPVCLRTRLSGGNGVSFVGVNGAENADTMTLRNTLFSLETANDYEGGTVVDMASVTVKDKDAFSSGDVVVKGSRMLGGSVVFACEGPFANDFTISKFGRRFTVSYRTTDGKDAYYPSSLGWGSEAFGALEFTVAGTRITGDVKVVGQSRISSYYPAAGAEVAIFEGVVSGDTLEIVDSVPNDNGLGLEGRRHKFVFCRDNTITGGVEVLNGATAVLRGANPSLGTGTVTLSGDAALRFENTAELDFMNKLYGAGTIQLGATKEVHFNGDISEFEGVIDLCGLRHEFSKVPPFAFTNTTGRATVAFKGGLGTVDVGALELTGEPKGYNLEIGAGTVLDLGGKTLTVRRLVEGEKSQVVNGELVETNPKRGMSLIVR